MDSDKTRIKADDESTRVAPTKARTPSEGATETRPGARATEQNPRVQKSLSTATGPHSAFANLDKKIAEQYQGKKLLKQRFALLEVLGTGGMGNVYLAKDLLREEMEDSTPYVAIKVLNEQCRDLPGALQSLQREAKKAQALSHPNIVTVYDFDRDGETAFITMEYIKGQELKDHLRKVRRIPHEQAMHIIIRVARGLAYAHQQGFAHSDIKPANIFLATDNSVKILDFGIAKAFKDAVKEKRSLADELTEGALTPTYASPQMLAGTAPVASDDVYSLACMAYEMLAGHHPFVGDDGKPVPADEAEQRQLKPSPIPGIPKRHMRAIRKGLAFEQAERFADAGLFIDAIKPRNLKKDLLLLGSAALITGVLIFAGNHGLEQVVPAVSSLKPELSEVGVAVRQGDELLATGDVDMAHRLYSQAWELANDLTAEDVTEREKAHAILRDRMNQVADYLIEQSQVESMDEYRLRELYVALEFLQKDEITTNKRELGKALEHIESRLTE